MIYNKISGFSDEISSKTTIQFEVLNKLGIRYFEPRGINGKNISELTCEEVIMLKQEMKKYGISASSIGSPVGKIKVTDNFEPHFELYKKVIEIAKKLECKYIRMFSFYGSSNKWTEEDRTEVFSRLKAMIDYAKKKDIILLHENEKGIYGDTIDRCLDIMQQFACENFGAVFDPANFVQCGVDTKEAFDVLKPYIKYIHIKDAQYADDRVVPAGKGDGNVPYILESLFKSGYNGFVSLEPHLGTFDGLADLELDDEMLKLPKGGEGTFTLAYDALISILKEII